jgi:polyprenyl-phospho-N-acetylgalactosaminyl synthase
LFRVISYPLRTFTKVHCARGFMDIGNTPRAHIAEGIPNADVFVVVPAYNEDHTLGATVVGLAPYGFSVVVVDDGSSVPAIEYLTPRAGQNVWYLRHASNLGQGAALQTGTEYALLGGAKIIVHFDADGQHDPALIHRLIEPIRNKVADVVLGSRFINGSDRKYVPLRKRMLLKTGVFVSWMFTGLWLTDTHNGFRALSRTAAECIHLTENGFAHATEILELVRRSGLRYMEVPVTVRYTSYSLAKGQRMSNSINILLDLVVRRLLG